MAFVKDIEEIAPVYNTGEFGEEVVLYFPPNLDNTATPANANRIMVKPEQCPMGGASLTESASAGATSEADRSHDFLVDMPAWCFLIGAILLSNLTVGAGNTVTVATRLRISNKRTGVMYYDETVTLTGIAADGRIVAHMPFKGLAQLLEQHEMLVVRWTVTATRTAGASNTQIAFVFAHQDAYVSSVYMHLHAAVGHAEVPLFQRKAG